MSWTSLSDRAREVRKGTYRQLFHSRSRRSPAAEDAANNEAARPSYCAPASARRPRVLERIRKLADNCTGLGWPRFQATGGSTARRLRIRVEQSRRPTDEAKRGRRDPRGGHVDGSVVASYGLRVGIGAARALRRLGLWRPRQRGAVRHLPPLAQARAPDRRLNRLPVVAAAHAPAFLVDGVTLVRHACTTIFDAALRASRRRRRSSGSPRFSCPSKGAIIHRATSTNNPHSIDCAFNNGHNPTRHPRSHRRTRDDSVLSRAGSIGVRLCWKGRT